MATTSSVSNTVTTNNGTMRLSGLASGLDTDSIIQQLMAAERTPLSKMSKNKQLLDWKKTSYRETTNALRGFKDDFFNITKPTSNMTSLNPYKKYTSTSSQGTKVTATVNSEAVAGTYEMSITQRATTAKISSSDKVSSAIKGYDISQLDFTDENNSINITLDGITKTIKMRTTSAYANTADLISNGIDGLQDLINKAFGSGKIEVSNSNGVLKIDSAIGYNGKIQVSSAETKNALYRLSLNGGDSNRLKLNDSLINNATKFSNNLTFADGKLNFSINDTSFNIDESSSVNDLIDEINNSDAGVELRYNETNDTFTMTAKQKGAGANIIISNTGGNLFDTVAGNAAIKIASGSVSNGKDAKFNLNGVDLVRNDNDFTINGITYSLLQDSGSSTITVGQDVDGIYNNIKSFIDKYNEVIGGINTKLSEDKNRDYTPLTDEQKANMKDADITAWEVKAKSGILKNDSILEKIVQDMRKAMLGSVSGINGSLSDIGITTSDYRDKGKLIIDEYKLKNAIRTNPDKVNNLFAKTSDIEYSPDNKIEQRTIRFNNQGIASRISDIIEDNIRTIRDGNKQKGVLLERAGLVGDITEYRNLIDNDINKQNQEIIDFNKKLATKEESYYKKYTALESYINKMNSQGSWLSQQLGTSG